MLVVTRHSVAGDAEEAFLVDAQAAAEALAARPGCISVEVVRAIDDRRVFLVVSRWADVGSYRRALSDFDVKIAAVPLLATAVDEVSAFEVLRSVSPAGVTQRESDVAADADTTGPR